VNFREVPKRRLTLLVPEHLDNAVREALGGRSLSAFYSTAVADLLGHDPMAYGLEPRQRRRREAASA
jgi:hypothetical protein